nr:hemerythrin domain-containing protein [Actinoplanes lichenis]
MTAHLPPLPPVGGETTGIAITDVVAREHRELLALAEELTADGTDAARRATIAQVLVASVARHLSAEEQYLYPAVRDVVPDGPELVTRELAEDRAMLEELRLFEGSGDPAGLLTRLRRHSGAASGELIPLLERLAGIEDLIRLGNRFETALEAAPTRPHPGTPVTPPWNKVVDPAVALVDKVRDVVGRRTTYPKDL